MKSPFYVGVNEVKTTNTTLGINALCSMGFELIKRETDNCGLGNYALTLFNHDGDIRSLNNELFVYGINE